MLNNFLTVAQNVVMLFLLMAAGYVCRRARILSDVAVKACANVVLYIATPCVIIKSCMREFDPHLFRGFLVTAGVAVATHLALILVAKLCFRGKIEDRRRLFRFATVFSNAGYMAIPLQQAILGDEGVFYCAAYVIVFNIVLWTYGVLEMSGSKKDLSGWRLAMNPGIIGVLVGLVVFFLPISVPPMFADAIGHLASLNTPIPMLIVGYYMAKTDLLAAFRDVKSYLCIFLRLVIMPLVALGAMLLCGIHGNVLVSCMICICTPVATACTMFATRYRRDPLLSVNLVSISTLFAVVTMPLIIAFTQSIA